MNPQGSAGMDVSVRLLGGFEVVVDGRAVHPQHWRRRSAAALVKLLALAPGRRMRREEVIDALWPDLLVDEAAPRLHKAAHYARTALGARDGARRPPPPRGGGGGGGAVLRGRGRR